MSRAEFALDVRDRMTEALARRIRLLRVDQGYTWRGVAEDIFDCEEGEALAKWSPMRGNQHLGMSLCQSAAEFLGEDPSKEPWN